MFRKQYQNLQNQQYSRQQGFTVTELLVVFLIIVALSSIVVVRWNEISPNRTLGIAQNEFITQYRKVQSYAVSSRNLATGESVKYYVMHLNLNQGSYSIGALDAESPAVFHTDLEILNLPSGVVVGELLLYDSVNKADPEHLACAWVVTSAVYGRTYFFGYPDSQKSCPQTSEMPQEFINTLSDPPALAARAKFNLTITLTHTQKNISKPVILYGLSGKVLSQ